MVSCSLYFLKYDMFWSPSFFILLISLGRVRRNEMYASCIHSVPFVFFFFSLKIVDVMMHYIYLDTDVEIKWL